MSGVFFYFPLNDIVHIFSKISFATILSTNDSPLEFVHIYHQVFSLVSYILFFFFFFFIICIFCNGALHLYSTLH